MQTEFPRHVTSAGQGRDGTAQTLSAAEDTEFDAAAPAVTDDDLELIDLRYDQFIAQDTLDHLMDDL